MILAMRRVALYIAFVLVLLGLLASAAQPSAAQSPTPAATTTTPKPLTFNVNGRVTSGTAGIAPTAGIPITLHVVRADQSGSPVEVVKRDTALAADNSFKFENVPAFTGDLVFVSTNFQGFLQGTPPVQLPADQTKLDLPLLLKLYGVTNDSSTITLLRAQHILDFKSGFVQLLVTHDYRLTGDRAYFSTEKTADGLPISIKIPLPIGARNIAFYPQNTTRFIIGGDVNAPIIQDTGTVQPEQGHQIVFSYQVPYSVGAPIDQDYLYATTSLEVLVPNDAKATLSGARLDGTPIAEGQFERSANTAINPKREYTQYTLKTPLKAGARVVYTLGSGTAPAPPPAQTAPTASARSISPAELVVIVILVAALVTGGFIVIRETTKDRKRSRKR